jgi:hypothetical protein
MKRKINTELFLGTILSAMLLVSPAGAQTASPAPTKPQDQSSLGDYARKVHKDSSAPTKPKVYDNDNLPKDDKLSIVGQPASVAEAAPADANEKSAAPTDAKPPVDGKAASAAKTPASDKEKDAVRKDWQDKLAAQKSQLDLASRELDVTQREYQLRAAAIYADTGNRLRNETQWDKEDADYKQKIVDKQKAVDDAKQKLADMQEEARKAGVNSSATE